MNSFLLNRQLGSISPQAFTNAQNQRLLYALQSCPDIQFVLHESEFSQGHGFNQNQVDPSRSVAHGAGVNSIAIDRFEGRFLLTGGADSSVAIWDLEGPSKTPHGGTMHFPLNHSARTSITESLGITHVAFYPFDSLAFLTSGYDRTVKVFSSETLQASATFDLGSTVYSHANSIVGSHLLVACASQHPAVRLVDLRSGSSMHALAGHSGAVIAVTWHPKNENILASGSTDGTCRLWDIRSSASSLGILDMKDNIGIVGHFGNGTGARRRERGKSHKGAVNGMVWTQDARYLVSTGQDEQMRVWDMTTGANTLANFGPSLKNAHTTMLAPLLAPDHLSPTSTSIVYYPNPQEILGFDLHSGTLLKRFRVPGLPSSHPGRSSGRNLITRTTSLAWRAHDIEMYSAHTDGAIRCWRPRTWEDAAADEEESSAGDEPEEELAERKRKRDELDQIVRSFNKKRPTV